MSSLPEILVNVDARDFDDQVIESIGMLEDDQDYESPLDWPDEWDQDRWEPGQDDETGLDPLADVWNPTIEPERYEPTPDDLREYAAWSESLERDRDFVEAMALADIADAEHERRRFKEEELSACGLPIG